MGLTNGKCYDIMQSRYKKLVHGVLGGEYMAETRNSCEGGDGMTDRQFLHHLRELLEVAKSCKDLSEFTKKLEDLISSYE